MALSLNVINKIFNGEYSIKGNFDYEHLKKIHEELFKEVYYFAGKERTIEIFKPEKILENRMTALYSSPHSIARHVEKATQQLKTQDFQSLKKLDECHDLARASSKLWLAHPVHFIAKQRLHDHHPTRNNRPQHANAIPASSEHGGNHRG
ncbi:MAG: Fic family protein [Burkholderiales bacterium]|nr:Fic family protein [Burkholderiales bacterium]